MGCRVAMASRALDGETCCGDQGFTAELDGRTLLCLADGLGHGVDAERAARAAVDFVAGHRDAPLQAIFAGCDAALRHTRGAVLGIALVDPATREITYAGVGNIRALLAGHPPQRLASVPGIVGAGYHPLRPVAATAPAGALFALFSDGLAEQLELPLAAPSGAQLDMLAGALLERWAHGKDDAAIVLCALPGETSDR